MGDALLGHQTTSALIDPLTLKPDEGGFGLLSGKCSIGIYLNVVILWLFYQFATGSMKILGKVKSAMILEPNKSFRNGS